MKLDKEWISNDIEIILLIVLPKTVYIVSYFFKILFYTSYGTSYLIDVTISIVISYSVYHIIFSSKIALNHL